MPNKIELKEIDMERWRFVLYTTPKQDWIIDVSYSLTSHFDLSMLILLNAEEKQAAQIDRNYLIEWSDRVRENPKSFEPRALNRKNYTLH